MARDRIQSAAAMSIRRDILDRRRSIDDRRQDTRDEVRKAEVIFQDLTELLLGSRRNGCSTTATTIT